MVLFDLILQAAPGDARIFGCFGPITGTGLETGDAENPLENEVGKTAREKTLD